MIADEFDERWIGRSIERRTWHFHRRLYQRYRLIMQPGEYSTMLRDIRTGRARTVLQRSPAKRVVAVVLQEQFERIFVLVIGTDYVVTALPPTRTLKRLRKDLP